MSFFRNAAGVLATRLGNVPIGLATSVVLARWLSVDDRGLYSVATAFAAMAMLVSQVGWPDAAIYRLRRVRADAAGVATAGLIAVAAVTALGVLVAGLLEPIVSERLLGGAPATIFYLAFATAPVRLLGNIYAAIARGIDRFPLQNAYKLLENIGVLLALCWVLIVGNEGLVAALGAVLVMRGVATFGLVAAVLRHTGLALRFDPAEMGDSLRFGFKSYLQGLGGEIHERIDIFMLAYLLDDPKQVAFYTIAVTVIGRLKIVPEAVGTALYPQLAGLPSDEAARFAGYVARQSLALVVLMMLALAPTANLLVPLLYGEAYLPSVPPLLILLPAMVAHTAYRVISRYFTSQDQQRANILTQLLSLPVNVGLNLWLIPTHGIVGAALSSLASYLFEGLAIVVIFRLRTAIGLAQLLVPQRSDLAPYRRRLEGLLARWRPSGGG